MNSTSVPSGKKSTLTPLGKSGYSKRPSGWQSTPACASLLKTPFVVHWADAKANLGAFIQYLFPFDPAELADLEDELDDYIDYIPCVDGAIQALKTLDPTAASNPLIVPTTAMQAAAHGFMNLSVDKLNSYTTQFQQIAG